MGFDAKLCILNDFHCFHRRDFPLHHDISEFAFERENLPKWTIDWCSSLQIWMFFRTSKSHNIRVCFTIHNNRFVLFST